MSSKTPLYLNYYFLFWLNNNNNNIIITASGYCLKRKWYSHFYYSPQSERNQSIFTKVKEVLKKEHGGESCLWTDLQMEGMTLQESIFNVVCKLEQEAFTLCKIKQIFCHKLDRKLNNWEGNTILPALILLNNIYP